MNNLTLKIFWALTGLLMTVVAWGSNEGRGGGDQCENRVLMIGADLKTWIMNGGARHLKLPVDVSLDGYSKGMLQEIRNAKIRCVQKGEPGYPVEINGTPKTCRFDKKDNWRQITCDSEKFQKISETEQYILIHHEYAGLADIERPDNERSHYEVSNQISGYLEDQVVKKLVVKQSGPPQTRDKRIFVHAVISLGSDQFSLSDVRFRYGNELLPIVPVEFTSARWYAVAEYLCKSFGFSKHDFVGFWTVQAGRYALVSSPILSGSIGSDPYSSDQLDFLTTEQTPPVKAIDSVTCRR
jgi:hypothetical protein